MEKSFYVELVANRKTRSFKRVNNEKAVFKLLDRFLNKYNQQVNRINESGKRTEYVCENDAYRVIVNV